MSERTERLVTLVLFALCAAFAALNVAAGNYGTAVFCGLMATLNLRSLQ